MNSINQSYIPVSLPSAQPKAPLGTPPTNTGHQSTVPEGGKVESDLSSGDGRVSQYLMASDEEIQAREKRAFGINRRKPGHGGVTPGRPGKPRHPGKPSNPSTPRHPGSPGQHNHKGGSNSAGDAANKGPAINDLHRKGVLPRVTSQIAASARSSFIDSAVGALIELPVSVGTHVASGAIADRIDNQAKMPGAEVKNADGTTSTVDPSATKQQKIDARLEGAEIKTEVMVNNILAINEGPDAKAVGKDPRAATDVDSRLKALESRMSATESQMEEIAKRYGLIYQPYVAPKSSETPTAASRIEVIEKRYEHMNKMLKRLIRNAEADAEDAQ